MTSATATLDCTTPSPAYSVTQPGLWIPAISLCRRELVRFLRQRHRIIGALATPIVFWLLIGGGMSHSFKADASTNGGGYMEYFFPGTILMIILFTAIFSTISIIEDRREGFLQSVLTAPVSRTAIVLGKILGGSTLAMLQGLLFMIVAWLSGIPIQWEYLPLLALVLFLIGFGLTGLGYLIAWPLDS